MLFFFHDLIVLWMNKADLVTILFCTDKYAPYDSSIPLSGNYYSYY